MRMDMLSGDGTRKLQEDLGAGGLGNANERQGNAAQPGAAHARLGEFDDIG
jgi:hypothetical protein